MAAILFSGTHTVVGHLVNGVKMVFTDVTPDNGTGAGVLAIDPLNRVLAYNLSVKENPATARNVTATLSTTSANVFTILPGGAMTASSFITIMSFGV